MKFRVRVLQRVTEPSRFNPLTFCSSLCFVAENVYITFFKRCILVPEPAGNAIKNA